MKIIGEFTLALIFQFLFLAKGFSQTQNKKNAIFAKKFF